MSKIGTENGLDFRSFGFQMFGTLIIAVKVSDFEHQLRSKRFCSDFRQCQKELFVPFVPYIKDKPNI